MWYPCVFQMLMTHSLLLGKIVWPITNVGILLKESRRKVITEYLPRPRIVYLNSLVFTEEVYSKGKNVQRDGL